MADKVFQIWGSLSLAELSGRTGLTLALLMAAICDIRARRIPNRLTYGLALAYVPLALVMLALAGFTASAFISFVALPLAAAMLVLAIGLMAFARGAFGGGDVKLLTALALYTGLSSLLPVVLVMAISGGVLSLSMLIWHHMRTSLNPSLMTERLQENINAAATAPVKVPYGVAIALGGIWFVAFSPAVALP